MFRMIFVPLGIELFAVLQVLLDFGRMNLMIKWRQFGTPLCVPLLT